MIAILCAGTLKSQFIKMPLYCSPWGGRNSITIVYYLQLTLSSFIVNDIVKGGEGTALPLAILLLFDTICFMLRVDLRILM